MEYIYNLACPGVQDHCWELDYFCPGNETELLHQSQCDLII